MASSAVGPTLIQSLPARPPTPPRDSLHSIETSVKSRINNRPLHFEPRSSLHTPPNAVTPSLSVTTDSNPSSTRTRKKVGWSANTQYKEPPQYLDGETIHKSSPLSLPPSTLSKPVKGILKPSSSPISFSTSLTGESNGKESQATISEMLDSTIKQLAGSDRDSKLDAYMMLARALKASNNLPDRVALQNKMSLFMQFIQRDIASKSDKSSLDSSLINHALSLLATFLHFPAIASTLTSDFGVFIIDHAIRSFEDPAVPKDVIRHLMQVVAFQNFSGKVMTADRVGRLVRALHNIENHARGKSIVMSRIHIYKRLVQQSRAHMAVHSEWLKDLFTDMLSTVQEIRSQAIALGMDAGYNLRSDKHVMRKVTEILQTADDDQVYIEFYIRRLEDMIKDKQVSSVVPQIWSVVILFMRNPLDKWQYYGPWLKLAQSTFNAADFQTKQEANYAWSRYIYLSLLDNKLPPKAVSTLCQPLLSQLRRRVNSKQAEDGTMKLRKLVIGGVCNLLYYGFKPSDDKYSPDMIWDVVVQPIIAQLTTLDGQPGTSGDGLAQASRILAGLLDVSTPRVWRQDRILDMPLPTPEELPSIDSKWVRRNSAKILQVVGPILERKYLDLANVESLTYRLWRAWVSSVAAASAKDIKVSDDTTQFFACTFEILCKVWSKGPSSEEQSNHLTFFSGISNFIKILVGGLGLLPFTEKKLTMTLPNTFEPIGTPSHRQERRDQAPGLARTPLQHLFSVLCSANFDSADSESFSDFLSSVFEPFVKGKAAKARFDMAKELIQLLPRNAPCSFGSWVLAADNMRPALEYTQPVTTSSPSTSNKLLGPEYREVVSLLERGLSYHPNLPSSRWLALFNLLKENVGREFGDAGRALAIIEPLAKGLVEKHFSDSTKPSTTLIEAFRSLFDIAKLPRDRQAIEAARRRLWGNSLNAIRGGSFDPFDNLYKLGNRGLDLVYKNFEDLTPSTDLVPLIESIGSFLARCIPQTGVDALSKLQDGLGTWLQDNMSRLKPSDQSPLSQKLCQTWDLICANLVAYGHLDTTQLGRIEPLLMTALSSKHTAIVSKAVETLNAIASDEESLVCSEKLKSVVSSLRSEVDVVPTGLEDSSDGFGAQTTSFAMSHSGNFDASSGTSLPHQDMRLPSMAAPSSAVPSKNSSSKKRRMESTPEVAKMRQSKRTSTPRLRHDNSQIQFAPIPSSSPTKESQHLTERQKEVRERQRENATLYTELAPSSSTKDAVQESREVRAGSKERLQNSTPTKATSYEEMISSTPTPRRGQVLHIDELNDPPSSPPEPQPRPHPLLTEIQSRSRASSSLDHWEFSSPPGSPITSRQQVADDYEPPQPVSTGVSSQPDVTTRSHGSSIEKMEEMQIIPSSFDSMDEKSMVDKQMPTLSSALGASSLKKEEPATPRRQTRSISKMQDTPKSADDEFVDARSSPERSSPLPALNDAQASAAKISSPLGHRNESRTRKLIVELESRPSEAESYLADESSPEKKAAEKKVPKKLPKECILVHPESSLSPSPPPAKRTRSTAKRASSPVIPSTPAEEVVESSQGDRKRKRKRGSKENRRKRRRSMEQENSQGANGTQEDVEEEEEEEGTISKKRDSQPPPLVLSPSKETVGVVTRRGARKQQEERKAEPSNSRAEEEGKKKDDGDTDEELMSQLFSESNAASQPLSELEAEVEQPQSAIEDSIISKSTDSSRSRKRGKKNREAKKARKASAEQEGNDAAKVIEALQGGLGQLRNASLTREDFYKIEDMLMDMKNELLQAERRGRKN